MPLKRLEHFLVITDDIDATRDFYCDVLGMTVGYRPELEFPGYWLYVGDVGCLHIAEWQTYRDWTAAVGIYMTTKGPSTGALDHVAFNATDYDAMCAKLDARALPYATNHVSAIGLRQIFVRDPNGLTLELNFQPAAARASV